MFSLCRCLARQSPLSAATASGFRGFRIRVDGWSGMYSGGRWLSLHALSVSGRAPLSRLVIVW